jgi:hypothetical protein
METEIVDDEEFAAIELALNAASALRGKSNGSFAQSNPIVCHPQNTHGVSIQNQQNQGNRPGTLDSFFQSTSKPVSSSAHEPIQPRQQPQAQIQQKPNDGKPVIRTVVTFQLVKNHRISVSTSNFNQRVIDVLKSIKDKSYDPNTREWSFGVDCHEEAKGQLTSLPGVEVRPLPTFVFRAMAKQSSAGAHTPAAKELVDAAMQRLPSFIKVRDLTRPSPPPLPPTYPPLPPADPPTCRSPHPPSRSNTPSPGPLPIRGRRTPPPWQGSMPRARGAVFVHNSVMARRQALASPDGAGGAASVGAGP